MKLSASDFSNSDPNFKVTIGAKPGKLTIKPAPTDGTAVQTGDANSAALWGTVLMLSGLLLAAALFCGKKLLRRN